MLARRLPVVLGRYGGEKQFNFNDKVRNSDFYEERVSIRALSRLLVVEYFDG